MLKRNAKIVFTSLKPPGLKHKQTVKFYSNSMPTFRKNSSNTQQTFNKTGTNTKIAKILFVTQSLIKEVKRYLKKELCGYVLKAKYVDMTFPFDGDDSPAKKLGRYFEYILTGAIPRNGLKPEAEY